MNKKTIIIVLVLLLATNAIQFTVNFLITKNDKQMWAEKSANLERTLKDLGTPTSVYTVRTLSFPGKKIVSEDLQPITVPQSFVGDSYVLDPQTVVGKYYKVAITPGTPITRDLIMDEQYDDTVREIDVTAEQLPIGLKVGDYVDLNILYPKGEAYVVLSKKRVQANNSGVLKMLLTKKEEYLYNAALVDYFIKKNKGASIVCTKYPEPGVQKAAIVNYAVPANISAAMMTDPNVTDKIDRAQIQARRALIASQSVSDLEGEAINSGRNALSGKTEEGKAAAEKQAELDAENNATTDEAQGQPTPQQ